MSNGWIKLVTLFLLATVMVGCTSNKRPVTTPSVTSTEDPGEVSTGALNFVLVGTDGNDNTYDKKNVIPTAGSPLEGKVIYWLGSSVTYGSGSNGQSMAHFMERTDGVTSAVEAVSGTTMATLPEGGEKSYITRLLNSDKLSKEEPVDLFVCQISTNDCKEENITYLGQLTSMDTVDLNSFDLATTIGSVEYLIRYVHDTWNCPIYFYSGSFFGNEGDETRANSNPSGSNYEQLVNLTIQAAEKWNAKESYRVKVIDLFHDTEFNNLVSESDYQYLMRDAIHPRKAGYLIWWLPKFQDEFYSAFSNKQT